MPCFYISQRYGYGDGDVKKKGLSWRLSSFNSRSHRHYPRVGLRGHGFEPFPAPLAVGIGVGQGEDVGVGVAEGAGVGVGVVGEGEGGEDVGVDIGESVGVGVGMGVGEGEGGESVGVGESVDVGIGTGVGEVEGGNSVGVGVGESIGVIIGLGEHEGCVGIGVGLGEGVGEGKGGDSVGVNVGESIGVSGEGVVIGLGEREHEGGVGVGVGLGLGQGVGEGEGGDNVGVGIGESIGVSGEGEHEGAVGVGVDEGGDSVSVGVGESIGVSGEGVVIGVGEGEREGGVGVGLGEGVGEGGDTVGVGIGESIGVSVEGEGIDVGVGEGEHEGGVGIGVGLGEGVGVGACETVGVGVGAARTPIWKRLRRDELRAFSYAELKALTRSFHRSSLVGEGGFGYVYKGQIVHEEKEEENMDVAVKQLNQNGQQGHKQWLAEVNFLGVVEHPNLVKLLGYCAADDERGIQRLLVYEFMPNKSLEKHLFGRGPIVLPWNLRLQIALGSARGLEYLHEGIRDLQIIFRDFKASNILLDNEFNPKLSDFGLAREGPESGTGHILTAVVGTIGYAAPEYIQTGHLTYKSDVYSYGVVLLELLCGRRSIDRNLPKNEQNLLDWGKPYLLDKKRLNIVMDPRLEGCYSLSQAQDVASLAYQCLAKHPKHRPKMSEVVERLMQIVDSTPESSANPSLNRFPSSNSTTLEECFHRQSSHGSSSSSSSSATKRLFRDVMSFRGRELQSSSQRHWRIRVPKLVSS